MNERDTLLILNAIGLTNHRLLDLISFFGSGKGVLSAAREDLISKAGLSEDMVSEIINFKKENFLEQELKLIAQHDVRIITFQDEEYPPLLKNIVDAPLVLYSKGILKAIDSMAVAIVGSRRASLYGLTMAQKLAVSLAESGLTIVSGLARGIDTAAHEGALKARGATVAVLGCGLSQVYPPENKKLFEGVCKTGCILSEFPMTTPPFAYNFPRRNRVISGLSLGVIVVEAFKQSGALITSRLAAEQGREVFAIPGHIDTLEAQGTNLLIQQGAKLVTGVQDILEELKPQLERFVARDILKKPDNSLELKDNYLPAQNSVPPDLPEGEKRVYEHLNHEEIHMDFLIDRLQMSLTQLSSILLNLQLKGLIKELPGKYFRKS